MFGDQTTVLVNCCAGSQGGISGESPLLFQVSIFWCSLVKFFECRKMFYGKSCSACPSHHSKKETQTPEQKVRQLSTHFLLNLSPDCRPGKRGTQAPTIRNHGPTTPARTRRILQLGWIKTQISLISLTFLWLFRDMQSCFFCCMISIHRLHFYDHDIVRDDKNRAVLLKMYRKARYIVSFFGLENKSSKRFMKRFSHHSHWIDMRVHMHASGADTAAMLVLDEEIGTCSTNNKDSPKPGDTTLYKK